MNLAVILPAGVTALTVNGLCQWDYGRKLEIHAEDLPALVEVHFACPGMKEAEVRTCANLSGVIEVPIPDPCLEQAAPIKAWIFTIDGSAGFTAKTLTLTVEPRTKPQPGATVPTEYYNKYTEIISEVCRIIDEVERVADRADHATEADHALEADHAAEAEHALTADSATEADHAIEADHALIADNATEADRAATADFSNEADFAQTADLATEATGAGHAVAADQAKRLTGTDKSFSLSWSSSIIRFEGECAFDAGVYVMYINGVDMELTSQPIIMFIPPKRLLTDNTVQSSEFSTVIGERPYYGRMQVELEYERVRVQFRDGSYTHVTSQFKDLNYADGASARVSYKKLLSLY